LTPDPIGLNGGVNLFVYIENNPINYIDPDGQKPLKDWTKDDFLREIKEHKKNINVYRACKDIDKYMHCNLRDECSNCCQALGKAISPDLWYNYWAMCASLICY